uniref:Transcription initiation factor TFIID subunit 11-like isoform X1 n=1 Tax=Dermatophagoides pteronyssinus TaxID=6956 RepID=A0A6P6XZ42_DERPT|nr:transcription initiation factor TFIID subunit 11-like isoform X1 [Dermatophagoides pteronyssinus]
MFFFRFVLVRILDIFNETKITEIVNDDDDDNQTTELQNVHSLNQIDNNQNDQKRSNNKSNKMAEEEIDIDLNDPEVGRAAVKIQAGFKTFMAGKNKNKIVEPEQQQQQQQSSGNIPPEKVSNDDDGGDDDDEKNDQTNQSDTKTTTIDESLAEIDLNDPDLERAAQKIQSSYRGFQKNRKSTPATTTTENDDNQ